MEFFSNAAAMSFAPGPLILLLSRLRNNEKGVSDVSKSSLIFEQRGLENERNCHENVKTYPRVVSVEFFSNAAAMSFAPASPILPVASLRNNSNEKGSGLAMCQCLFGAG